jgi:hypothetical protein
MSVEKQEVGFQGFLLTLQKKANDIKEGAASL